MPQNETDLAALFDQAVQQSAQKDMEAAQRAEAERQFAEESGAPGAMIRGAMSGATMGLDKKMLEAIDAVGQELGLIDQSIPTYLSPQQKIDIVKKQNPNLYALGEGLGGLVTAFFTRGGSIPVRIGQGAAIGAVEGAAKSRPDSSAMMDSAIGALIGGASEAIPGAATFVKARRGAKAAEEAIGPARAMAEPLRREYKSLRAAYANDPRAKMMGDIERMVSGEKVALQEAKRAASEAEQQAAQAAAREARATESIFDLPSQMMTPSTAASMQSELLASRAGSKASIGQMAAAKQAVESSAKKLTSFEKDLAEFARNNPDLVDKLGIVSQAEVRALGADKALMEAVKRSDEAAMALKDIWSKSGDMSKFAAAIRAAATGQISGQQQ